MQTPMVGASSARQHSLCLLFVLLLCFPLLCNGNLPVNDGVAVEPFLGVDVTTNEDSDAWPKERATMTFTAPICPQVPICYVAPPTSTHEALCRRSKSHSTAFVAQGVAAASQVLSTTTRAVFSYASQFRDRLLFRAKRSDDDNKAPPAIPVSSPSSLSASTSPSSLMRDPQSAAAAHDDTPHTQYLIRSHKSILRNLHELLIEGHAPNPVARESILSFLSQKLQQISAPPAERFGSSTATTVNDDHQQAPAGTTDRDDAAADAKNSGSGERTTTLPSMSAPPVNEVLYLIGTNGVGKTHAVRLISLAWSLHCAAAEEMHRSQQSPPCEYGDALLWLSGTSFAGAAPEDAARWIEDRVCAHGRRLPRGMILLDDVSAFPSGVLLLLTPLLGGGNGGNQHHHTSAFERCPDVDVQRLLIIMTSDFGTQQRQRREQCQDSNACCIRSSSSGDTTTADDDGDAELIRLIPKEFQFASHSILRHGDGEPPFPSSQEETCKLKAHGAGGCGEVDSPLSLSVSTSSSPPQSRRSADETPSAPHLTIVPLREWSVSDARVMIATHVQRTFGCTVRHGLQIVPVITDAAVDYLLGLLGGRGGSLWTENGHAVMRVVRSSLDSVVLDAIEAEIAIDEYRAVGLVVDAATSTMPHAATGGGGVSTTTSLVVRFVQL
jgi:hypothetical protein